MFQQMINGSIAVLTRPSASTFEEVEQDNLTWALIYSVIAGIISAIFGALRAALFPATVNIDTTGLSAEQAAQMEQLAAGAGGGIIGAIIGGLIVVPIVLLISWGITYGLGRAFGGTGKFGELAWGLSLFGAPLAIANGVLGLIPVLGGLLGLVLLGYNFYLTYLAIQSGMNLEPRKALYVILIEILIAVVIGCFIFGAAILAIIGLSAATGG